MRDIILFGGSFDPPGLHHSQIIMKLKEYFSDARIIVVPCEPRGDKNNQNISLDMRIMLIKLAFRPFLDNFDIELDLRDLTDNIFTPTYELDKHYSQFGKVHHFVGADIVAGGANGTSEIHGVWTRHEEDFNELNFIVGERAGVDWAKNDFPPNSGFIPIDIKGSSTEIRRLAKLGDKSIRGLVSRGVYLHIVNHNLYGWTKGAK